VLQASSVFPCDRGILVGIISYGGSPRAFRAWPLAWPSPSGPDNVRRSGPVLVTFHPGERHTWRAMTDPGQLAERRHSRCVTAGRMLRPVRGIGAAGSGPRRCATALKEAGQAAPPHLRRESLSRSGRHAATLPGHSRPPCMSARPRRTRLGPVGVARRRCALEAVEKVVTAPARAPNDRERPRRAAN
jgi:hypothetical protein